MCRALVKVVVSIVISLPLLHTIDAFGFMNQHGLHGPFTPDNENLKFWDLTGSSQLDDHFVRLTTDEPGKQGAIWNKVPCQRSQWEIHVHFHIHGKGMHFNGDGMAIWYVKEPLQSGPVFGSKDYFSGVGIFIDTFQDPENTKNNRPYISGMVNNGSIHCDAAGEDGHHGSPTEIGYCFLNTRNLETVTRIAVSYVENHIKVFVDTDGFSGWKQCFSAPGIYLPTEYQFGVSASTGALSDNHDVISIATLDMSGEEKELEELKDVIPVAKNIQVPKEYLKEYRKEKKDESIKDTESIEETASSGSWMKKSIYALGIVAVLVVLILLIKKAITQRRERMQKRLF